MSVKVNSVFVLAVLVLFVCGTYGQSEEFELSLDDSLFEFGNDTNPFDYGTTAPAMATTTSARTVTTTSSSTTTAAPAIKEGCGWRNPLGVGRTTTTSDDQAKFGEFPWTVIVFKMTPLNGKEVPVYIGGGSLIHMKVVLTTAHYVYQAEKMVVRAGEWDIGTTDEPYPFQERNVEVLEVHKDFNRGTLYYDVALLFLSKAMDPAPNVGIACLPPPRRPQVPGTRCFSTGWGKDKFVKGQYQSIPKKVEVPVVKPKTCQDLLRQTRLGVIFELHRSFMCAGGEVGQDTCKGDGGSPLVCPMEYETDRYVQAGITSWGVGCGGDGTPGVYVDVSVVRDFIDDKMGSKGYGEEMFYEKY